jgi:hypothetical protein
MIHGNRAESYMVLHEDGITTYEVSIGGREVLDHPLVSAEAIRVSFPRPGSGRPTTTWLAPELSFLPVRIQREGSGLETTLILKCVEGLTGTQAACNAQNSLETRDTTHGTFSCRTTKLWPTPFATG